ncbi:hypothetical protein JRQ81_019854 [Phrynocephalus forsythii]|uniref:Uncharacterized protein n=1 Tax=Phrynocephalus forsythii TaxID=171643 RepID=A0A9Q0XNQ6_9SAUR|nr:hypothetical protein JRQ81_019854 [Phrynocephalus forsythii]
MLPGSFFSGSLIQAEAPISCGKLCGAEYSKEIQKIVMVDENKTTVVVTVEDLPVPACKIPISANYTNPPCCVGPNDAPVLHVNLKGKTLLLVPSTVAISNTTDSYGEEENSNMMVGFSKQEWNGRR